MTFRPTAKCTALPDRLRVGPPPKPCPELSDTDIDDALSFMLAHGADMALLPLTQYGRRTAVAAYLAYEAIKPVNFGTEPPAPFVPSPPR